MITTRAVLRRPFPVPPPLGLATAGVAATAVVLAAPLLPFGDVFRLTAAGRVLLLASALAILLTTVLAPHRIARRELIAAGMGAIGGQALLMSVTDPLAISAVLLLIGCAFAARPSARPFSERVRGPVFAALLIGVGWTLLQLANPSWAGRVGALGLALGLAAGAGLVPYLSPLDPEDPASSSYLAWTGLFGPALAIALPARVLHAPAMAAGGATIFGGTLVALGLVNLAWGTVVAWRTASDAESWRMQFLVDWGLALIGLGLLVPDGLAGAFLAMLSIVLVRVPLYLWARPALLGKEPGALGTLNVLFAVLLVGSAPFGGFPVRLLVLGAAAQASWPLAVPMVLAMLLAVTYALRLARTLGSHHGREAAGPWIALGLSLALGLASGAVRALGGL